MPMPISYRAESDAASECNDKVWVTSPVDSGLSQRNQPQAPLGWETSLQNAMFYSDELWRDAAMSSSSSDISSPHDEQLTMTVWEASSRKGKEYMLDRQQEQDLNQDQDPILFPYETSPFDLTSLSREHIRESSLTRRRRQNRNAQRAFRARERIRVQGLEDRLEDLTKQYSKLESAYIHLNGKYQSLLEKVEIKEEIVDASMPLWQQSYALDLESSSSLLFPPEALLVNSAEIS